jgi:DNA-binding CsgD family transcriptional regulator
VRTGTDIAVAATGPGLDPDRFARLLHSGDASRVRVLGVADQSRSRRARVLDECATLAARQGLTAVRGRVRAVPYGVFADTFEHPAEHRIGPPGEAAASGRAVLLLLRRLFRAPGALGLSDPELRRVCCAVLATLSGPAGLALLLDDLHLADHRSFALLDELVHGQPRTPLVLVLAHDPRPSVPTLAALLAAAERRSSGGERIAPVVELRADPAARRLTQRERTVLTMLAEGLTAEAIARRLDISPRTVHRHLQHLYRKLGTADRLATVLRAKAVGLLP